MELMVYVKSGGVIMEILIAMNTVGIALMLFKAVQFWLYDRKRQRHAQEIFGNFEAAGIREKETMLVLVKELLQTHLRPLEKGLPTIKIIASTATLFGLLGTVIGVLMAFESIAKAGMGDPTAFAGGVSMALVTTVGGLIVAIIHTIGYNYLVALLDDLEARLEAELLKRLYGKAQ
ncbi:MAG: MotA/TolQ/ExbB proton channel family protein [Epsilonproteobacteria bacterium]|nr:MotA/TolQ/ExbB proton channel family protein [Campylobacterota bacterium]